MRKLCTIKMCFLDADTNRPLDEGRKENGFGRVGRVQQGGIRAAPGRRETTHGKAGFDLIICQDPSVTEGGGERLCDVAPDPIVID